MKALKTEQLADADTRDEYDAMAGEFSRARELITARSRAGLTQGEVQHSPHPFAPARPGLITRVEKPVLPWPAGAS